MKLNLCVKNISMKPVYLSQVNLILGSNVSSKLFHVTLESLIEILLVSFGNNSKCLPLFWNYSTNYWQQNTIQYDVGSMYSSLMHIHNIFTHFCVLCTKGFVWKFVEHSFGVFGVQWIYIHMFPCTSWMVWFPELYWFGRIYICKTYCSL